MLVQPKSLLTYQKDICIEVIEAIRRRRLSRKAIPPIDLVSIDLLAHKLNPLDQMRLDELRGKFIIYNGSNRAYEAMQRGALVEANLKADTPGLKFLPLMYLKDLTSKSDLRNYEARKKDYVEIW